MNLDLLLKVMLECCRATLHKRLLRVVISLHTREFVRLFFSASVYSSLRGTKLKLKIIG